MNDRKKILSIIIPVYNGETYIKKCIDNLLSQDCTGVEILIIDDGSTDHTLDICNRIQQHTTFLRVIEEENKGPGFARNEGIKCAKGEYLVFLDVDDCFMPKAIYTLKNKIQSNSDIINFNFCVSDGFHLIGKDKAVKGEYPSCKTSSGEECLDYIYNESGIGNFSWAFMYKKDFLLRNELFFPTDIFILEDAVFLNKVLRKVTQVSYISTPLYCYFIREDADSLSKKKNYEKVKTGLNAIDRIFNMCINEHEKKQFARHAIELLFFLDSLIPIENTKKILRLHHLIYDKIIWYLALTNYTSLGKKTFVKIILLKLHLYDTIRNFVKRS